MAVSSKIYGYCDRFDYHPGASIDVMLHSEEPNVRVDVVHVRSADERVTAISPREELVGDIPASLVRGRKQLTHPGSYVLVEGVKELRSLRGARVEVWVYPTLLGAGHDQGVFSWLDTGGHAGAALVLAPDDHVELRVGTARGPVVACRSAAPLLPRTWTHIEGRFSAGEGATELSQSPFKARARNLGASSVRGEYDEDFVVAAEGERVVIGAEHLEVDPDGRTYAVGSFNGKIEAPILSDEPPSSSVAEHVIGQWDFSLEMNTAGILDRSRGQYHGKVVNAPTRAVTGHSWRGDEVDWRLVPQQYAAIHFHEDDLEDAGWPPSCRINLPDDMPSGIYAVRAIAGDSEDAIPFFVLPGKERAARPPIAFLASTWTYQAYANSCLIKRFDYRRLGISQRDYRFGPRDNQIDHSGPLACSLYDLYRDGSGRCYSSLLRPMFTFRTDYTSCVQGAPRHLGADLYITGWLEVNKQRFDVVTDHYLDSQGIGAIAGYKVLITSTHPEYASARMLQALGDFLDAGGSIMYLGGNGFYWVTSQDPVRPHLIECRRGNSGTRTWDSPPGETHHNTTGEPGGLWRYRGRAPNALVGVGMASQGWDWKAPGFHRTPESFAPGLAWIFEGVPVNDVIADTGLVMDGGSGDELDRFDPDCGSPPDGVVVATSLPHSKYYKLAVEDVLMTTDRLGGDENSRVRSDITYISTASGAGVFSIGSITWAGAMAFNNYENSAARISRNVLERFLDTRPVDLPLATVR